MVRRKGRWSLLVIGTRVPILKGNVLERRNINWEGRSDKLATTITCAPVQYSKVCGTSGIERERERGGGGNVPPGAGIWIT